MAQVTGELTRTGHGVKWDMASMVCLDIDGDGITDRAVLGYRDGQILVAVRRGPLKHRVALQTLGFGIDPNVQEAICALPAKLTEDELVCTTEAGPLPGCKPRRGAKALTLNDNRCDPIHLYWSHKHGALAWWRE